MINFHHFSGSGLEPAELPGDPAVGDLGPGRGRHAQVPRPEQGRPVQVAEGRQGESEGGEDCIDDGDDDDGVGYDGDDDGDEGVSV